MKLRIYRTLWGYHEPSRKAARSIAEKGYDGIESTWPRTNAGQAALAQAARSEDLDLAVIVLLEGSEADEQLADLSEQLSGLLRYQPERIVVHSGCDSWSVEQAVDFYRRVTALEEELGARCAHETHRQRSLATPWSTEAILRAVPNLLLCCDFSHWVVVCERLLDDQVEAVHAAAERTIHVHTRVGSPEAPQLANPGSDTAARELMTFERWWRLIWDMQAQRGDPISTCCPEYGPPPYQPAGGTTSTGLAASLDRVCDWQAARLRTCFNEQFECGGSK